MLLIFTSLGSASAALVCLIISLILLFLAAFVVGSVSQSPPLWYNRISFGWAGMFFFVLSVALS